MSLNRCRDPRHGSLLAEEYLAVWILMWIGLEALTLKGVL